MMYVAGLWGVLKECVGGGGGGRGESAGIQHFS